MELSEDRDGQRHSGRAGLSHFGVFPHGARDKL